jgi:hypothetical protein
MRLLAIAFRQRSPQNRFSLPPTVSFGNSFSQRSHFAKKSLGPGFSILL